MVSKKLIIGKYIKDVFFNNPKLKSDTLFFFKNYPPYLKFVLIKIFIMLFFKYKFNKEDVKKSNKKVLRQ